MKLGSRYADYSPEYSNYFGIALRLLKYMYGMTNSGNLFSDESTEWFLESGLIKSQYQMFIDYKCAPYGTKMLFCIMLMNLSIGIFMNLL